MKLVHSEGVLNVETDLVNGFLATNILCGEFLVHSGFEFVTNLVLNGVVHGAELVDSNGGVKGSLVGELVLTTETELDGSALDTFEAFSPTVGELVNMVNLTMVRVSATKVGEVSLKVSTGVDISVLVVPDKLGKDLLEVNSVVLNRGTNVVFILNTHVNLALDGLLLLFVNLNGELKKSI